MQVKTATHRVKKTAHVLPAVHSNWMVARLLLLFLHRSNDVDHAFAVGGDAHLWPAMEVELTDRSSFVLLWGMDRGKGKEITECFRSTNAEIDVGI